MRPLLRAVLVDHTRLRRRISEAVNHQAPSVRLTATDGFVEDVGALIHAIPDAGAQRRVPITDRPRAVGASHARLSLPLTDLLVAYETSTASGKATKARSYSVPIVTTGTFASARLGDHLEAETSAVEAKKVVTCPDCHATWTVSGKSGGQSSRRCPDCATTSSPTKVPEAVSLADATAETLECSACGRAWNRERVRGRKPHRCPDCAV